MIVLLLAVIIASNVYGDLEVVNVKIGTYRKDHPSLAYATRQTLANDVCSLLEALKWNWDAFLYGYISCKSLSNYKNNEVVISHFHFNNVTCRYCFSDTTENFVEACPQHMLLPTRNNSYSKYVGKTQYPIQLWVHRKEHWSQDEEINRKYVDELENELQPMI
ncbi:hypothetical protein ANCCAN_13613 [Ancylostoma caninum]|uniref:Uncharacterized protein n=1 Tax=Ancylostoma caninum TaxID=29170 RepID=A0A368G7P5_ANCCA|nr:hypothetical protein ANCCAN_13613 [Ancylostoma caninum]